MMCKLSKLALGDIFLKEASNGSMLYCMKLKYIKVGWQPIRENEVICLDLNSGQTVMLLEDDDVIKWAPPAHQLVETEDEIQDGDILYRLIENAETSSLAFFKVKNNKKIYPMTPSLREVHGTKLIRDSNLYRVNERINLTVTESEYLPDYTLMVSEEDECINEIEIHCYKQRDKPDRATLFYRGVSLLEGTREHVVSKIERPRPVVIEELEHLYEEVKKK